MFKKRVGGSNGSQALPDGGCRGRNSLRTCLLADPIQASLLFSGFAEPRAVLYLRFCGAAVLVWGLIVWFARDFRDWAAVQSVLIASVVGLVANIIINVWATFGGWLNGNAWGSTVVLVLLLLGGVYELVVGAAREG